MYFGVIQGIKLKRNSNINRMISYHRLTLLPMYVFKIVQKYSAREENVKIKQIAHKEI